MTLAARIESALRIQTQLQARGIPADTMRLASDAAYACAMETAGRDLGRLDESLELLSALVDTIVLSGLPMRDESLRSIHVHPAFADTVAEAGFDELDGIGSEDRPAASPMQASHARVRAHFEAGIAYLQKSAGLNALNGAPELLAAFVVAAASESLARALASR